MLSPHDHNGFRASHRADRVGDADLRGFVEHHDVEKNVRASGGEEPCHRVRTHQRARQDLGDQLAEVVHQSAHAHSAALAVQLALEQAYLPALGVCIELAVGEQPPRGDGTAQLITDRRGAGGETLDRLAVCGHVELAESAGIQTLGDRRGGHPTVEGQAGVFGHHFAGENLSSRVRHVRRDKRLDVLQQRNPSLDGRRRLQLAGSSTGPPLRDKSVPEDVGAGRLRQLRPRGGPRLQHWPERTCGMRSVERAEIRDTWVRWLRRQNLSDPPHRRHRCREMCGVRVDERIPGGAFEHQDRQSRNPLAEIGNDGVALLKLLGELRQSF